MVEELLEVDDRPLLPEAVEGTDDDTNGSRHTPQALLLAPPLPNPMSRQLVMPAQIQVLRTERNLKCTGTDVEASLDREPVQSVNSLLLTIAIVRSTRIPLSSVPNCKIPEALNRSAE